MSVKKITFDVLNRIKPGVRFSALDLASIVKTYLNEYHHIDTYLRYLRYYRAENGNIICINRQKSLYEKTAG